MLFNNYHQLDECLWLLLTSLADSLFPLEVVPQLLLPSQAHTPPPSSPLLNAKNELKLFPIDNCNPLILLKVVTCFLVVPQDRRCCRLVRKADKSWTNTCHVRWLVAWPTSMYGALSNQSIFALAMIAFMLLEAWLCLGNLHITNTSKQATHYFGSNIAINPLYYWRQGGSCSF